MQVKLVSILEVHKKKSNSKIIIELTGLQLILLIAQKLLSM